MNKCYAFSLSLSGTASALGTLGTSVQRPFNKQIPVNCMPLKHKYQDYNFGNGFETENSVLKIVPYNPEVIFIGTYNHGWSWNNSDFFYGRGMYMWTIMANLFLHNNNHLTKQRTITNNIPCIHDIFEICQKGKFVFADIVKGIKDNIPAVELSSRNCVLIDNSYCWESRKIGNKDVGEYSDTHLENLAKHLWLDDNVKAIIKYVNETKSINHIYFTFKSGNWLVSKLDEIKALVRPEVSICSIFTPTSNGFGKRLMQPFNERAWGLTHCWIWNGLEHDNKINRPGYGHLDHKWLSSKGVNVNNF